jgi:hypothetical protein
MVPDRVDDTRSLRVFIKTLRQKLEPDSRRPRYLISETGLGYRLCVDEATPIPEAGGDFARATHSSDEP